MTKQHVHSIKTVTATKEGRFWSIKIDGKLLAVALYKIGAFAVRDLVQQLAGLPPDEPAVIRSEAKTKAKPAAKKTSKPKATSKAKPPQKQAEPRAGADTIAPATTT